MRNLVALCITLARAILGDTRVRRQWMFLGTLIVLGFVFGGYFIAGGLFRSHPVLFAIYILASLIGVVFLVLFAAYDMLMIRREFLGARRAAHQEMLKAVQNEGDGERGPGRRREEEL
ncbi:MAG: hypothetical protein ACKV19_14180 [Verrucomicrobiales bacterium]